MTTSFEAVWITIIQKLQPGEMIRNWGHARGYTGGTFRIDHVGNSSITATGGKMSQPRTISKGDFQNVYAVWSDYCAGDYPRAEMVKLSQNTTYILSILRRVEVG